MSQLTAPVSARDHVRGSIDAPVTMVEYADFECPYCAQAYPVVKAFENQLGDMLPLHFVTFRSPRCITLSSLPKLPKRPARNGASGTCTTRCSSIRVDWRPMILSRMHRCSISILRGSLKTSRHTAMRERCARTSSAVCGQASAARRRSSSTA